MNHPFTYDELFSVLRRVMSDADAAEVATASILQDRELGPAQRTKRGLTYQSVVTIDLTEDTLVLLSLESRELAAKVEAYRSTLRAGHSETPAEAQRWNERRKQLERWRDDGYRRIE